MVIDDIFYNLSKRFPDRDVIYAEEVSDLKRHFPYFNEDLYDEKLQLPLMENYKEILRIATFDGDDFPLDKNKL